MMRKTFFLVFASILLTACVDVGVNQKLYRDNTVDMSISFAGTDQVLVGFENMKPQPTVADKFTYTKGEGMLTYSFSRIPSGAHLFILDPEQDSGFFGIEEYTVTKKKGFPFYRYTYTLTPGNALPADQSQQAKAILGAIKIKYRVETFGKITETNGEKIDDKTAEFTLDPTSTTPYTIEFREWFLSAWFG